MIYINQIFYIKHRSSESLHWKDRELTIYKIITHEHV